MSEAAANEKPAIHVVAGVLRDQQGRVLLARRREGTHQGGRWEFPGGKLEPGESRRAGLRRELFEELGVTVTAERPLICVPHEYPERRVLLDVWVVIGWEGEAHGREGQPVEWVAPEHFEGRSFPPADVPVLRAIDLPPLYLVTPDCADEAQVPAFLEALEDSLSKQPIELVQLRVKSLPGRAVPRLADAVARLCAEHGVRLLLNGDVAGSLGGTIELSSRLGAGLHLTGRQLKAISSQASELDALVAASCHGIPDLQAAQHAGVDFAVLSPVLPTASHPDVSGMGWKVFETAVAEATIPVYALGGVGPGDLETAWCRGAQGIAAIRSLWGGPR